ncbi:unnamed protein product [Periconia digitata]|uniref:Uncharacterized protein n=1 Tax=Periconia digitata TaxID=1303443 RepID=A0A9W4XN52_9PLEO|nr:unnamed protein product [Periconia digitata]
MSKRFSRSPDPRNDLFSSYNRSTSPSKTKNKGARSPYGASPAGYGYSPSGSADHLALNGGSAFSAYPGNAASIGGGGVGPAAGNSNGVGYRSATPNSRGQYSAQAMEELESQNEEQFGVLTGKVKMLKDVSFFVSFLSPTPSRTEQNRTRIYTRSHYIMYPYQSHPTLIQHTYTERETLLERSKKNYITPPLPETKQKEERNKETDLFPNPPHSSQ